MNTTKEKIDIKFGHCKICRYMQEQIDQGESIDDVGVFKNKCECSGIKKEVSGMKQHVLLFKDHVRYVDKFKFNKFVGKTIVFNGFKFKTTLERSLATDTLKGWQPQGIMKIFDEVGNTNKNLDTLITSLNSIINTVNNTGGAKTIGKLRNNFSLVISDICVAFMNLINSFLNKLTIMNLAVFLVNMYHMFMKVKLLFVEDEQQVEVEVQPTSSHFVPQIGESFLLGLLSTFLPTRLIATIRNAGLFSNTKILDDYSLLYDLFSDIRSFFDIVLEHEKMPVSLKNILTKFLDCTPFNKFVSLLYKMRQHNMKIRANRTILLDGDFQESCLCIREQLRKIDYVNRVNKNKVMDADIKVFLSFCKTIDSYKSSIRIEPNMFVFEGKPGIGKTYTMNILSKTYGVPIYNHVIPDRESGKDFYDDYDNEDIYVMDDIGQMGTSQWSPIMNFISSAKMPLMCAQAEYKNTKFLTSRLFLATTNQIEGLSVLRCDGISDIAALYRRVKVFKYEDDDMVVFKQFNLKSGAYEEGFGKDTESYTRWCEKHGFRVMSRLSRTSNDFYIWLRSITDFYLHKSVGINKLQQDQIDIVINDVEQKFKSPFAAQSLDYVSIYHDLKDYMLGGIGELINVVVEYFSELFTVENIARCLLGATLTVLLQQFFDRLFHFFDPQCLVKDKVSPFGEMKHVVEDKSVEPFNAGIKALAKQVFCASLQAKTKNGEAHEVFTTVFVSGNKVLLPFHSIYMFDKEREIYMTVYQNYDKNIVLYDHVPLKYGSDSFNNDIAVLTLPHKLPSMLKDFSNHFNCTHDKAVQLLTPYGIIDVEDLKTTSKSSNYTHKTGTDTFHGSFDTVLDCFYSVQANAMCGSILVDKYSNIIGMHVAGHPNKNIGVSKVWNKNIDRCFWEFLSKHDNVYYNVDIVQPKRDNVSVVKIDNAQKLASFVPKKSKIVESPIYGVSEVLRKPAVLDAYGSGTIKEMANKNYVKCADVDLDALDFAKKYVSQLLPTYDKISDYVIVKGDEEIKPLNKDTSAGFGYGSDKTKFIDFKEGVICQTLKEDMYRFESACKGNSELAIEMCISVDTLKDELRDIGKIDRPRVFKMANLLQTVLCKRYFGDLLRKLHRNRWSNGIMIGCNPFVDFEKLVKYVERFGDNVFDGDYKNWDGNMLPQFQFALKELIASKYVGDSSDVDVIHTLLSLGINTPTLNMNELLITTHSLPSGWFLTADFNSLINKMYIAYVYFIIYKNKMSKCPTIENFNADVMSFVYGDDVLIAVSDKLKQDFNGPAFGRVMQHTGILFTPAHKGEWDYLYKSIYECTFLKRGFSYHPVLNRVVCPLDIKTVLSTLNYVGDKSKINEITIDKLHSFQRELFLHFELYDEKLLEVKTFCEGVCFPFNLLGVEYLVNLYESKPDEYASHIVCNF